MEDMGVDTKQVAALLRVLFCFSKGNRTISFVSCIAVPDKENGRQRSQDYRCPDTDVYKA